MNVFPLAKLLPDVQEQPDTRGVALDEVGIDGLSYPLTVQDPAGHAQATVADTEVVAALDAAVRGTHMSRFVEVLHEHRDAVTPATPLEAARVVRERLGAEHAAVAFRFPLFVERAAPVTKAVGLLRFDATLRAASGSEGEVVTVGARVPVTSLCPCSKDISDYGAHSQRGYIDVLVDDSCWSAGDGGLWPQELLTLADSVASAPIYPLLKRVDERHVTMRAYDSPAFVEDLARDMALALKGDERVAAFSLGVTNEESIHDHRAVARVRWSRA